MIHGQGCRRLKASNGADGAPWSETEKTWVFYATDHPDNAKHTRFSDTFPMCGLVERRSNNSGFETGLDWWLTGKSDAAALEGLQTVFEMFPKECRKTSWIGGYGLFRAVMMFVDRWPPADIGAILACEAAGVHPFIEVAAGGVLVGKIIESPIGEKEANDAIRAEWDRGEAAREDRRRAALAAERA